MKPTTVLDPDFIPPTLLYRDKQLKSLSNLKGNYYCGGESSTGKTTTVLKLKTETLDPNPQIISLYLPSDRALMRLFKELLVHTVGYRIPKSESPFEFLVKYVKSPGTNKEQLTMMIDDVQKVENFRVFYNFLHSLYETTIKHKVPLQIILVGTTPYPEFVETLKLHGEDRSVINRLQLKPVYFPSYNSLEIAGIIKQRLDLAELSYEEGAINFMAGKLKYTGGDLRLGFTMLKNARSKLKQGEPLTLKIMKVAWDSTKIDYWANQIEQLNEHIQLLILSATLIAKETLVGERTVETIGITKIYYDLCERNGLEPLYAQRVTEHLKKIVKMRWLTRLHTIGRGRYGYTTVFKYENNPDTILKTFKTLTINIPSGKVN